MSSSLSVQRRVASTRRQAVHALRRRQRSCRVLAAPQSSAPSQAAASADVGAMRQQLLELAGDKIGTDLTEEQQQAVLTLLERFEGLGRPDPEQMELTGTDWKIIFTNATGATSGKLGPLVGENTMLFPADGDFIGRISQLGGALVFDSVSTYAPVAASNQLKMTIDRLDIRILGKTVSSKELGLKAHHVVKYAADDLRVFTTNKGTYMAAIPA